MKNKRSKQTSLHVSFIQGNLSDSEFIAGIKVFERYPIPSLSNEEYLKLDKSVRNHTQEHLIEITRTDLGESRNFSVLYYAELILEGFLDAVDKTEHFNEKMLILINAKRRINSLEDSLIKFEKYDFTRLYKRINDSIEYLKNRKEYELAPIKSTTVSEASINKPTPRQLAFYTYFLIQSNSIEPFIPLQKNKQVKELCKKYGGVDSTNFQKHFNLINKNYKERRKGTSFNITDLKIVCEMLKESPNALIIAKQTLKEADENKS